MDLDTIIRGNNRTDLILTIRNQVAVFLRPLVQDLLGPLNRVQTPLLRGCSIGQIAVNSHTITRLSPAKIDNQTGPDIAEHIRPSRHGEDGPLLVRI